MDASSIITQVYRDDDPSLTSTHPTSEKVVLTSPPASTTKPKRQSLFKQFICCFRPSRSSSSERNGNAGNSGPTGNSSRRHIGNKTAASCNGTTTRLLQSDDVVDARNVTKSTNGINDQKTLADCTTTTTLSLLPQPHQRDQHKKCVVIDLDETLVHSSFAPVNNPDFIIPVEIDGTVHQVYVLKRPYVDEFLQKMGELFECVLFTASLGKYADPVTDLLDKWGVFRARLFREACVFHRGNYVKDLSRLGRDLNKVVIIDNSPASYLFHPENAVPIVTWFDDPMDRELLDLVPFFERLATVDDVYEFLGNPVAKQPGIEVAVDSNGVTMIHLGADIVPMSSSVTAS